MQGNVEKQFTNLRIFMFFKREFKYITIKKRLQFTIEAKLSNGILRFIICYHKKLIVM